MSARPWFVVVVKRTERGARARVTSSGVHIVEHGVHGLDALLGAQVALSHFPPAKPQVRRG